MSDDNVFTPTNEQGVVYLFSKYHEKLGFEKILHITTHFPDVIAIKNSEQVMIELEYHLSGVQSHYIIKDAHPHSQKWVREREDGDEVYWRLYQRRTTDPTSQDHIKWIKTSGSISISKEMLKYIEIHDGALTWKSLKPLCDVVICWEIDCELDDPNIEIIELKTSL